MKRRHLAALVAALTLIALPATAEDCQALTFDAEQYITSRSGNDATIRTGAVGPNLWVQVGEYTGQDEYEGTISYPIPAGASSATVCPDGSVVFRTDLEFDPMPTLIVADVEPVTVEPVVERAPEFVPVIHFDGGVQEF